MLRFKYSMENQPFITPGKSVNTPVWTSNGIAQFYINLFGIDLLREKNAIKP